MVMMLRINLILILIFGLYGFGSAQEIPSRSVYAELWGAGLTYSLNYDLRFDKEDINSWGMRIGAGGWATSRTDYRERFLTVPVQFNRLLGNNRHLFEYGGGASLLYFRGTYTSGSTESINKDYNFLHDADHTPALMGTLLVEYRFIPNESGITFRANMAPFFNNTGFWVLFGGMSLGYAF